MWCPQGLSAQHPVHAQPKGQLGGVGCLPKGMMTSVCHATSPLHQQVSSLSHLFCISSPLPHSQTSLLEGNLSRQMWFLLHALSPTSPWQPGVSPNPRSSLEDDSREVLASSRSFGGSISSAVSGTQITGPLTNLLSPAFPGIAARAGSPPAAFPAVPQGLAAKGRQLLSAHGGSFGEEE